MADVMLISYAPQDKEIGRLIAQLKAGDVDMLTAATKIQEQLDSIRSEYTSVLHQIKNALGQHDTALPLDLPALARASFQKASHCHSYNQIVSTILALNGGPVDADTTTDGIDYVLVRRELFDSLSNLYKEIRKADGYDLTPEQAADRDALNQVVTILDKAVLAEALRLLGGFVLPDDTQVPLSQRLKALEINVQETRDFIAKHETASSKQA
jgi:ribonucleotide reductase beta subunit family protein with ferritin-like domain